MMKISYDNNKRLKTLQERGLDFADAVSILENAIFEYEDIRKDYGEKRMLCYGILRDHFVVVGYVQRGDVRHIFTMRKVHDREVQKIRKRFH